MIRRLFIYGVPLGFALLVWTQAVEAQGCFPGNIPTMAVSSFQVLDPSQVPFAAVTLTVSAIDGSKTSHNATIGIGTGVQTTRMLITYKSYNAASVAFYNSWDSGPRSFWFNASGTSGSFEYDSYSGWPSANILNIFAVATEKQGSGSSTPTTQDVIHITTTNQAPGIYQWDSIGTQAYDAVTITYSGTPQISFADCPGMRTARHTPTATLQLQSTSGEVRNTVQVVGQTVNAGSSVFSTATDYISVNVGDEVTASFGGFTFCDVDETNFFADLLAFRVEYAKVVAKDLGHPPRPGSEKPVPSVIYDVAPICDNDSDPSDWQPTVVHSWSSRHPYWWGVTSLFRWPDIAGVTWIPVASYLSDIGGLMSPEGGPWNLAALVITGGAVPYPAGQGPLFPVPGKCTRFVGFDSHTGKPYYNVLFTLSSPQIPSLPWPFNSN